MIKDDIAAIALTGWAHMKLERERFGSRMKAAGDVITHVSKQSTRVKSLFDRSKKDDEKEEDRKAQELAAQASNLAGDMRRQQARAALATVLDSGNSAIKTCNALDNIPDSFPVVQEVTEATTLTKIEDSNTPLLIRKKLEITPEVQAFIHSVLKRFQDGHLYSAGTGRASDNFPQTVAGKLPACPLNMESAKVRHGLTGADKQFIDSVWCFAYAKTCCAAGPEYLTLPSIKYCVRGQRSILLIEFQGALKFAQASMGQGASVTLGKVVDMLRNADKEFLTGLAKHAAMFKVSCGPECSSFVPACFLVFERTDNNQDVTGIRWSKLPDYPSDSYAELAKVMMPDDPKGVKANSTAACMAKVIAALQSMGSDKAKQLMLQPVKQEAMTAIVGLRSTVPAKRATPSAAASSAAAPAAKIQKAAVVEGS